MTFLLDINVLIALIDPAHVAHDEAHGWFDAEGRNDWATCPLTENGVIRIIGHAKYPNTPGSPVVVAEIVRQFRQLPGHRFWPDELSIVDYEPIDLSRLLTSGQITDTYLLALAQLHGGKLATFDRKLSAAAVSGGRSALRQIGS